MKFIPFSFLLVLFVSCSSSELSKDFQCTRTSSFDNFIEVQDIQKLFSVQLPKNWKRSIFYNDTQSSIYAADTTLNLTKAILFDASLIYSPLKMDASFKEKIMTDHRIMKLTEVKRSHFQFNNAASYYTLAKGKKEKFPYHVLHVFSKINTDNFLHIKAEIYGDSLVDKRICDAIEIIEQVQWK